MSKHLSTPWHVDPLSATVYASDVPKGPARVADMRGWGYLTGHGHGALALSQDEAIDIQRANAAFIVKAVNNHDALVKALEQLLSLMATMDGCDCDSCRPIQQARAALSAVTLHKPHPTENIEPGVS